MVGPQGGLMVGPLGGVNGWPPRGINGGPLGGGLMLGPICFEVSQIFEEEV